MQPARRLITVAEKLFYSYTMLCHRAPPLLGWSSTVHQAKRSLRAVHYCVDCTNKVARNEISGNDEQKALRFAQCLSAWRWCRRDQLRQKPLRRWYCAVYWYKAVLGYP